VARQVLRNHKKSKQPAYGMAFTRTQGGSQLAGSGDSRTGVVFATPSVRILLSGGCQSIVWSHRRQLPNLRHQIRFVKRELRFSLSFPDESQNHHEGTKVTKNSWVGILFYLRCGWWELPRVQSRTFGTSARWVVSPEGALNGRFKSGATCDPNDVDTQGQDGHLSPKPSALVNKTAGGLTEWYR
jgi:hypothetical protein